MFGSTVLEVAIGLVFIYLLLSLLCSAINEWIAQIFALRARTLSEGIKNLLRDKKGVGPAKALYSHGLIDGLSKKSQKSGDKTLKGRNGPSYIPPRAFATALMDHLGMLLLPNPQAASDARVLEQLKLLGRAQLDAKVKQGLTTLIKQANGDIAKLQQNIETWFNDAMDRVSGWYKRRAQVIGFVLGLVVTLFMNADTIYIAQTLSRSPTMRAAVIADAQKLSGQTLPEKTASDVLAELKRTSLPLGWQKSDPPDPTKNRSSLKEVFMNYGWMPIIGWLLTAAALSLGASFWFDLLNKIMHIRSTGATPVENRNEPYNGLPRK